MTCMCMGPQKGAPLCPCMMRAARAHMRDDAYVLSVANMHDDPRADHDDYDDGEVRCASCKQILRIERGMIDHQCPTTGR